MQTRHQFDQWKQTDAIPFDGSISVILRADQLCKVYAITEEGIALLVGHFTGEEKVTVVDPYFKRLEYKSKGNVWVRDLAVNQSRGRDTDVVFTTLDRPAKLSPEMQAIQRLARQNEIMRERDLRAMEQRYELLEAQHRASVGAVSAETRQRRSDDDTESIPATDQSSEGSRDEDASTGQDDEAS